MQRKGTKLMKGREWSPLECGGFSLPRVSYVEVEWPSDIDALVENSALQEVN